MFKNTYAYSFISRLFLVLLIMDLKPYYVMYLCFFTNLLYTTLHRVLTNELTELWHSGKGQE